MDVLQQAVELEYLINRFRILDHDLASGTIPPHRGLFSAGRLYERINHICQSGESLNQFVWDLSKEKIGLGGNTSEAQWIALDNHLHNILSSIRMSCGWNEQD